MKEESSLSWLLPPARCDMNCYKTQSEITKRCRQSPQPTPYSWPFTDAVELTAVAKVWNLFINIASLIKLLTRLFRDVDLGCGYMRVSTTGLSFNSVNRVEMKLLLNAQFSTSGHKKRTMKSRAQNSFLCLTIRSRGWNAIVFT